MKEEIKFNNYLHFKYLLLEKIYDAKIKGNAELESLYNTAVDDFHSNVAKRNRSRMNS